MTNYQGVISCQRERFHLPQDVAYLNCAYMSPQLVSVEEAGLRGMRKKRLPFQISVADFFEEVNALRSEFAGLINFSSPESIAILPSVSYGMAQIANNLSLGRGEEIVIAGEQFPSNVYPWQQIAARNGGVVVQVKAPEVIERRGELWNINILEAINHRTKLVALGQVHWADGTKFDLAKLRERCDEVGALLVIDGTQSVGALPFDLTQIKPDALICAGYKWLWGPYSMALGYFGERLLKGFPIEESWKNRYNSEDFTGLVNYEARYQPGALRFDVGENSNFILVPMMLQAIKEIRAIGVEAIQAYCQLLVAPVLPQIAQLGLHIEAEEYRGSHLFGLRFGENFKLPVFQREAQKSKLFISIRGNALRISPSIYNNAADFEVLIACLKLAAQQN